ncbi:MAG: YceI family protein [Myxococcales bacterium]|nr:YceI family protein [Myxococcales bacterium]
MSTATLIRSSLLLLTIGVAAACAPDPTATAPAATVGSAAPAEGTAAEGTAAEGSAAEGTAAEGSAAAPAAEAITMVFGPDTSTVGFVGSKVTGSHEGSFQQFTGTLTLATPVENSTIDVQIVTDSLVADNERLTGHLKSPDFFDTATYPNASFVSTGITALADNPPYTHTLTGNLSLHGQTREISFPATITVTPEQVTATSEFSINRMDFGIVFAGQADDLIREGVLIKLNIVARPGTPAPAPTAVPAVPAEASAAPAEAPAAGSAAPAVAPH